MRHEGEGCQFLKSLNLKALKSKKLTGCLFFWFGVSVVTFSGIQFP